MRITKEQVEKYQEWQAKKAALLDLVKSGDADDVFDKMCETIADYAHSENWAVVNPNDELRLRKYHKWIYNGSTNPGWYLAENTLQSIEYKLKRQ